MERMFMQRRAVIELLLTAPFAASADASALNGPRARWFRLVLDVRAGRLDVIVTFWEAVPREIFVT